MTLAQRFMEDRLLKTMHRVTSIDALSALISAMEATPLTRSLSGISIAFDTNALLHLSQQKKSVEVADFLATKHEGPLIIPGQAIQEFWNNELAAIDNLYTSVDKRLDPLRAELKKLPPFEHPHMDAIEASLAALKADYANLYGGNVRRSAESLLKTLKARALIPFVSRDRFCKISSHRKQTKTPPGFKDDGEGDFYIWADFLLGLLMSGSKRSLAGRAVLVTDDAKVDWSRNGVAHPILAAELYAVCGLKFEIWPTKHLVSVVEEELES